MTPGKLLCSGTGGPPLAGHATMTCPICRHTWDTPPGPAVPRHYVTAGASQRRVTRHLDAAEGHFARCQNAEALIEAAHGPHPSVRHYPLGQLARGVWHVAAANVLLALGRPCPRKDRYR